jgi:hypothetical protein
LTKNNFKRSDIIAAINQDALLFQVEVSALNKFRNKGYIDYAGKITSKENVRFLARPQLEALCLYGYDKSYDDLIAKLPRIYSSKEHIELIKVKVPKNYDNFLCTLLSSLEKFNHGNSPVLMNRVMEMLIRETRKTTEALNESAFYRDVEAYIEELSILIKECNAGFGVNVTDFNSVWGGTIGLQILETNKIQYNGGLQNADGTWMIKSLLYRRIFLMTAETQEEATASEDQTIIEELNTIKKQLEHKVEVFCIFKNEWKNVTNHNKFDFAVLKIDECPMLMGTIFDESTMDVKLKKGVFFTDTKKAKEHYDMTLGVLLSKEDIKVYNPELNNGVVDFKNSMSASKLKELKEKLNEIITAKK